MVQQTVASGLGVFLSWVRTPIGALLFILLCGSGVLAVVKRGARWAGIFLQVVATLFSIWVLGGILEAWGIPVREMIRQLGSYMPSALQWVADFIRILFTSF